MYARQTVILGCPLRGAPGEHWASGAAPLTASLGSAPGEETLQVFWSGAQNMTAEAHRAREVFSMYHWTLVCASFASPRQKLPEFGQFSGGFDRSRRGGAPPLRPAAPTPRCVRTLDWAICAFAVVMPRRLVARLRQWMLLASAEGQIQVTRVYSGPRRRCSDIPRSSRDPLVSAWSESSTRRSSWNDPCVRFMARCHPAG